MVGDPSGKSTHRALMETHTIQENIAHITHMLQRVFRNATRNTMDHVYGQQRQHAGASTEAAATASSAIGEHIEVVNNAHWLCDLPYIEFLTRVGRLTTVNRMLSFDSVRSRLAREQPLSFLEFNYMLLQAYDFAHLGHTRGVRLQLGGSDQWGNIVCGVELGRKMHGLELFGVTVPLLTTADGRKMGKSESGAVWLDPKLTSEFDFWQYWRNTPDADVARWLAIFSQLPMERVEELAHLQGQELNVAKAVLADEVTSIVHGRECLPAVHQAAEALFRGRSESGDVTALPTVTIPKGRLEFGNPEAITLAEGLVAGGLADSRSAARRLIEGGGVTLNQERETDPRRKLRTEDIASSGRIVLGVGRKRFIALQPT
jgi:tyrosyl-tRNA synthetase